MIVTAATALLLGQGRKVPQKMFDDYLIQPHVSLFSSLMGLHCISLAGKRFGGFGGQSLPGRLPKVAVPRDFPDSIFMAPFVFSAGVSFDGQLNRFPRCDLEEWPYF